MDTILHPNEDWQSRRSVVDCNRRMWTDQLGCDIKFLVGHDRTPIGAHRYVLGSRSCVFYAMLYGPLSRNTGTEVIIPEMTPEQFNGLLQFLYTEEVKVDLNNVLALLYGAKKYCVQSLIDKCLNTLKRNMVPENVCTVMENAHVFGNNDLKSRCFRLILQETDRVFQAEDLAELCNECFINVVKDDSIPVSEEAVFEAVLKFGKAKCERNGMEPSLENLKAMVIDVLPHVRFPLMSQKYVTETVDDSRLLDDRQTRILYRYFLGNKTGGCEGFNSQKRKSVYTVQRFTDLVSGWGYKRDKCDAISFTCNKDILMKGIQVYGSCQGPGDIELGVRLIQEPYQVNIAIKHAVVETDGKQKIYNIFFDNPGLIKKGKLYSVCATIKGPTTYYGSKGESECIKDGVAFTFQKSSLSTNNTTPERGQIPGIVYELMPETEGNDAMEI